MRHVHVNRSRRSSTWAPQGLPAAARVQTQGHGSLSRPAVAALATVACQALSLSATVTCTDRDWHWHSRAVQPGPGPAMMRIRPFIRRSRHFFKKQTNRKRPLSSTQGAQRRVPMACHVARPRPGATVAAARRYASPPNACAHRLDHHVRGASCPGQSAQEDRRGDPRPCQRCERRLRRDGHHDAGQERAPSRSAAERARALARETRR